MFLTAVAWVLTPHVVTNLIDKGYSALTVTMGAGFVNGAIGGGMKGGVIGAFSAGLFHGIGSTFTKEITPWAFNGNRMSIAGRLAKAAAHGTAAGVTELLRGGKFGHGFVSAAGPELLHPEIGKLPGAQLQTLGAALLGGALSHATGGKFANGAATAAFMWAFNHQSGAGKSLSDEQMKANDAAVDAAGGILAEVGMEVVAEAEAWKGTTWKIYQAAGLDYDYENANSFRIKADSGVGPFRRVYFPRPGDVVAFAGHLGVVKGVGPHGLEMWTAFHTGGPRYNSQVIKWWGKPVLGYYRYVKEGGEK
jgi:hypothetical protein